MTIDEAIKSEKEHEQIVKWLEELKELRVEIAELHCERQTESVFIKEHDAEIRADVYDEIISALQKEISYLYKGDINCGISVAIDKVKLMKEQESN